MNRKAQKIIRRIQHGLAALLVTLLVGCSASQPSAGDGERTILDRIKSESEGRIKLVSFKKTDGQKQELMGGRLYSMEYQAEIEVTEDCYWVTQASGKRIGFQTLPLGAKTFGFTESVKKGHRETLTSKITFEKMEKGWRAKSDERE